MKKIIPVLFGIAFLLACDKEDPVPVDKGENFSFKSLQIIEQSSDFAWNLFHALEAEAKEQENVVYSPLSVTQAFGMAISGATGGNLQEMLDIIGFSNTEGMNEAFRDLRLTLDNIDPTVTIGVANSAWNRDDFFMLETYTDILRKYYNAQATALDFSDEVRSLEIINGWVNENTNGKIPEIVEKINRDHVLFLINGVYFNGSWTHDFNKESTVERPFYLTDGSEISVDMMVREAEIQYLKQNDYSGVRLPYGNAAFSMTVLLPGTGSSISQLVNQMDKEMWAEINQAFESQTVTLGLPGFQTECKYDLIPALKSLGMNRAFMDASGFMNISNEPIVISDVTHKTFIEVDEKGTEASAATSIGFIRTSVGPPAPPLFMVNHPFVFIISEKESNALLFVGKIENPLN